MRFVLSCLEEECYGFFDFLGGSFNEYVPSKIFSFHYFFLIGFLLEYQKWMIIDFFPFCFEEVEFFVFIFCSVRPEQAALIQRAAYCSGGLLS